MQLFVLLHAQLLVCDSYTPLIPTCITCDFILVMSLLRWHTDIVIKFDLLLIYNCAYRKITEFTANNDRKFLYEIVIEISNLRTHILV